MIEAEQTRIKTELDKLRVEPLVMDVTYDGAVLLKEQHIDFSLLEKIKDALFKCGYDIIRIGFDDYFNALYLALDSRIELNDLIDGDALLTLKTTLDNRLKAIKGNSQIEGIILYPNDYKSIGTFPLVKDALTRYYEVRIYKGSKIHILKSKSE